MKKQLLFISCLIVCLLFQQCQNLSKEEKTDVLPTRIFSQYSIYTEKIIKNDSSIIHGLNLNVSKATIVKVEQQSPVVEKEDTLVFNYQIDNLVSYSIKYSLQNDSLEEINVWIYSNHPDSSAVIFKDLKDYYQKKLPNPIEDKGYVVYNCVQGERRPFVVSISDFSTPNKGQINLVIYKDK